MTLAAGTKLGPYEIQTPIGAGGMGEVYRARDTRLDRDVAIKVLPEHLSSNPELKQRFDREARAISSLNHPRICTLYDVGHQDGIDFLVMEFLEGESLAQRLKGGPVPFKETLRIAIDICEALDKAHRAGIIHRDLKPANIMLTRNGAKLMDFGLAKSAASAIGSALRTPLLSAAQTMSEASPMSPLTTAGAVIGTIQYMAPEQIEGKDADARSDIFALGAVLYEMFTGKRPFEGKSQISVASAILEKDPEPISRQNPAAPPAFDRLVNACLTKNPDDRVQSAHDVKLQLVWIMEAPPETRPQGVGPQSRSSRLPWIIAGAAVLALIAAASFLLFHKTPPVHYVMVSYREGVLQAARFSHDGQTIVFSGKWEGEPPQVSTTRVGNPESRPLGIGSATIAAVSPSDELAVLEGCDLVFLLDCGGTLASVSLSGGSPREIAAHVAYADWSPDSKQLAVVVNAPNDARVESPPGHVLYEQKSGWLSHPRFSPDGTLIAFGNHPLDSDDGSIDVVDLQGKRRIVTQGWLSLEGLAWYPDGKEIWFAGTINTGGWADAIHAVSLSGKERTVLTMPWIRLHDISKDGRVLLSREDWHRQLVGFFPGDKAEHGYSWLDSPGFATLSNDGRWVSFAESGEIYNLENDRLSFYRRTDGSAAIRVGPGQATISPDGKMLVTNSIKGSKLLLQPVGVGDGRELPTPGITAFNHIAWSDDAAKITYEGLTSANEWDVYTQRLDGSAPVLIARKGRNSDPTLSPDGKMLAMREENGGVSLYREGSSQPTPVKGASPADVPIRFVNHGQSLLVSDITDTGLITVIDLSSGHRLVWKRFADLPSGAYRTITVTPDLNYYAYDSRRYASNLYLVENLY